ncbi:glycosyltransferase [Aerococcaceae bacterium 50-4]
MKKNIILLIPQLRHGGAERVVSRLSFILNKEYNLKVVVFDDHNITYELGCDLINLEVPPISEGRFIKKVFNILKRIYRYRVIKKKYNVDLTYSFGDTANIINIFSGLKDKKISSIRGFKRIRKKEGLKNILILRPLSKFILRNSDSIVSVSELITQTLVKEYELPADKIETIYNGYNIDKITELSQENITDKTKLIFKDRRVLITAGTFRQEKGYWHLLKAFYILRKKHENLQLVILGTDYNNYKERIVNLAKKLNVSEHVHMLGYQDNPFKFIAKSDIYLLSSVFEGFPNALVEAMACGIPVVAADCESGPREIISPKSNIFETLQNFEKEEFGILVERLNKEENFDHTYFDSGDYGLVNGVEELIEDAKLQEYYSKKSLERARKFSNDEWKKKNQKLINQLLYG